MLENVRCTITSDEPRKLPVGGVVKDGARVTSICIVDSDHELDDKIDRIRATSRQPEFVKKANSFHLSAEARSSTLAAPTTGSIGRRSSIVDRRHTATNSVGDRVDSMA